MASTQAVVGGLRSLIRNIGGRKFAAFLIVAITAAAETFFNVKVNPDVVSVVVTAAVAYITGESVVDAVREYRNGK